MRISLGFFKWLSYCISKFCGPAYSILLLYTSLVFVFVLRKSIRLDPHRAYYIHHLYLIMYFLVGLDFITKNTLISCCSGLFVCVDHFFQAGEACTMCNL